MRQFTPHQGRYGINPAQPHRNKGSVGLSKTSHQVTKVLIKGESLAEEEPASLCIRIIFITEELDTDMRQSRLFILKLQNGEQGG
ncbi:uncharacterized protein ACDP82_001133 isoform 2-T2 [Pangshura tecta]